MCIIEIYRKASLKNFVGLETFLFTYGGNKLSTVLLVYLKLKLGQHSGLSFSTLVSQEESPRLGQGLSV